MIPEKRLISLYRHIYSRQRLVFALKIVGAVSVGVMVLLFAYAIGILVFFGEYISALKLVALAAVPFGVVSFARHIINCKRPYEVFDIPELSELRATNKAGHSFPSRHVFSAFLIGVLFMKYSIYLGIAALAFGLLLAVTRVLLGIHFIKDVAAGAVIGALSGFIGILIW